MRTTMNWDDIKIFLALARSGSVRAAADSINTSHSTVARRIVALEKQLNARLFDRTSTGYKLAQTGMEVLSVAESMERDMATLERRIAGKDQRLTGQVKVATTDFLATHLLAPALVEFARLYPEIEVEIITGYNALDLDKREADIALRITMNPPSHLVGKRLASVAFEPYATRDYLRTHDLSINNGTWIGYQSTRHGEPDLDWVKRSPYPQLPVRNVFENLLVQFAAVRAGLGVGMLPCVLGESDAVLIRLMANEPPQKFDLWLLTHRDVRTTARLRALMRFITSVVTDNRDLLEGKQVTGIRFQK